MAPAFHACLSAIAAAALIVHDPLESSEPRASGGAVPVAAASASSEVSAENLQRTVRLLSADAFEGRKLGSAGSRAAARYMAAELEAVGLEPLGQAGTFLAPLTLVQRRFSAPPELRVQTSDGVWHQLEAGTEFGVFPTGTPPTLGEVAVRTAGTEEEVRAAAASDVALALTGSQGRARRWLDDPALADRRPPIVLVPGGDRRGTPIVPGPFGPATKEPQPGGEVRLTLSGPLAERLAAGEVVAVDFVPHLSFVPVDDVNLVGVLRGVGTAERPELAQEAIVVSAHRDHIGIQAIGRAGATEADVIANGADDDASGCAVALELARCLTAGPRPARSVVFLLVTGEEAGLLGSGDYVDAPAWPIERTVANLNLEMLGMPDPLTTGADGVSQPWLTGFERSTLGEALVALGLPVVADPRPKMNFFARSDNVSFARLGVVAHTLSTGGENPNYHQVRDEWHTLDYAHMARCAEVGLVALRALASGELTPTWRDGEPRLGR